MGPPADAGDSDADEEEWWLERIRRFEADPIEVLALRNLHGILGVLTRDGAYPRPRAIAHAEAAIARAENGQRVVGERSAYPASWSGYVAKYGPNSAERLNQLPASAVGATPKPIAHHLPRAELTRRYAADGLRGPPDPTALERRRAEHAAAADLPIDA